MRIWQYTTLDVAKAVGGVESHISSVSGELRKMGHEVHIGAKMPENWTHHEVIVHTHGDTWIKPEFIASMKKTKNYRWIHIMHGTSIGRLLACREYFSISGWKGTARDFLPAKFCDAAITVGKQALIEGRRYFRMNVPAKIIPNGVNESDFGALKEISNDPKIIFIGRGTDRVKNTDRLLQACAKVYKENNGFRLLAAPGLEASFPFIQNLGTLRGEKLAAAMAGCKALVLVSLYEGDPVVLREAQAMGLPVLVSDIPQIRANLYGYPNTVFVEPHSIDSLIQGIEKIMHGRFQPTPHTRPWRQVAAEFESFYKEVIAKKK